MVVIDRFHCNNNNNNQQLASKPVLVMCGDNPLSDFLHYKLWHMIAMYYLTPISNKASQKLYDRYNIGDCAVRRRAYIYIHLTFVYIISECFNIHLYDVGHHIYILYIYITYIHMRTYIYGIMLHIIYKKSCAAQSKTVTHWRFRAKYSSCFVSELFHSFIRIYS